MRRSVLCPYCNRRLFDAEAGDKAVITVKCPKCRTWMQLPINDSFITPETKDTSFEPIPVNSG